MQTTKSLLGQLLTATKAPPTQNGSVNMTAWAEWFNFDTTGTASEGSQLEAMVNVAARFVLDVRAGAPPYWLSFLGTSGAGKSYLAKRIWDWFKGSSHFRASVNDATGVITYPGSFVFWPDMADALLSNAGYERTRELASERLVVLDEVGSDRDPSGHVRDCLVRLLSSRVGKWTIITTNKNLGQVQRDIDTRISSRMLRGGSVVLDVDIDDYSMRAPKATAQWQPRIVQPQPQPPSPERSNELFKVMRESIK